MESEEEKTEDRAGWLLGGILAVIVLMILAGIVL